MPFNLMAAHEFRALAHEFPGDVTVSVRVGEVGQVAHLQDLPARNSQGRVFPAAPPGCLPHLLQGPDDTTFHSAEPPNQYSSEDQICLLQLGPMPNRCPVEHRVFSQLGSPSSCMGYLEGWGFQVVGQEGPFTTNTLKKKSRIQKSECVPEAIAIVGGNLFTCTHNARG